MGSFGYEECDFIECTEEMHKKNSEYVEAKKLYRVHKGDFCNGVSVEDEIYYPNYKAAGNGMGSFAYVGCVE